MAEKIKNHYEDKALEYLKQTFGDSVTGAEYLGQINGKSYYLPLFVEDAALCIGQPFLVVYENGRYNQTTGGVSEYNELISSLQRQRRKTGR